MRYELIRDLLHHLDTKYDLAVGNCEAELANRIKSLPLPLGLKHVFMWSWPTKSAQAGRYYIYRVPDVFSGEWFGLLLESRMLGIGSAANGDELVVKFSQEDCEVGFLDHVELAVAIDEGKSPATFYTKVCASLDDLLLRLVEGKFLPIDYWSACDLNELKAERQKLGEAENDKAQ
jgi:hypothetical protein